MRALEALSRVLPSTPEGRSAIASAMLAAMASAQATYAAQPRNQLWQTNPGEGDPGGTGTGTGTGTGPGAGTWTGPGQGEVASYWWGWQMCFDEEATKWFWITTELGFAGTVAIGSALALLAPAPPVAIFMAALGAWFFTEFLLIALADHGNGVCISMSWAAPGLFIATSR